VSGARAPNTLAGVPSPVEVTSSPGVKRRRPGIALTLAAVISGLVLVSATAGHPPGVVDTPASRFLPTDGRRVRYTSASGTLTGDWAVDTLPSLFGQGPRQLSSWMEVTELDWRKAALTRLSTVEADAAGTVTGRYDDFYSLTADGIRAEVSISGDGTAQLFVPGRLDLSATPSKNRTWTSEGALGVLPPGGKVAVHSYHVDYSSAAATGAGLEGCVVVTARQRLDDQQATTWQNTWCPGSGVVAFTSAEGTEWTSTTEPGPADPGPAATFDWSSADRLAFSPRKLNNVGDEVLLTLAQTPAALPDGTAVAIQSTYSDVVAIDTSAAVPPSTWRARPGGRPTSIAAFNAITLVATTGRELVAYGPAGDWRWAAQLSDLTVVPPVRIGDVAVVAALDGSVTGYDAATGTQRWRRQPGIEVRVAMATLGDRVVVIDQAGALTCLDASGAEAWRTDAGTSGTIAITAGPDPVVVVPAGDAPRITAYSLADGSEAWQVRDPIVARSLIGLASQVVVRDGNRTMALDEATGATRWTWDAERTHNAAGGGDRLLLVTGSRLVLLDGSGRQVREWPLSLGAIDDRNTWLTTSTGHVLVFGPRGLLRGVAG
jgi:outer membrane protein assembly factor BamB